MLWSNKDIIPAPGTPNAQWSTGHLLPTSNSNTGGSHNSGNNGVCLAKCFPFSKKMPLRIFYFCFFNFITHYRVCSWGLVLLSVPSQKSTKWAHFYQAERSYCSFYTGNMQLHVDTCKIGTVNFPHLSVKSFREFNNYAMALRTTYHERQGHLSYGKDRNLKLPKQLECMCVCDIKRGENETNPT